MTTDPIDTLKHIPFAVYAVRNSLPQGSCERELLHILEKSITADIAWAAAQLEAERKERKQ